ncbi:MAG TPA: DUF4040 domain-containing protein [Anaerolineae bacterium]|nr:DUF4040 domain-containing protein [Anaerolineae bacterium]
MWIEALLLLIVVLGACLAMLIKDLFKAVIALGVGSAALAAVFFLLGSPYAGAFELSVGAGLVSVLLISAISLTAPEEGRSDE